MFLNVKAVSVLQSEEKHLHGLFEVPASHHLKRQGTRPYWPAGKQIRTRCPRDHHHVLEVMWSVPVGPSVHFTGGKLPVTGDFYRYRYLAATLTGSGNRCFLFQNLKI